MINLEIFIAARAQVFIVNIGDEYLENPPRTAEARLGLLTLLKVFEA